MVLDLLSGGDTPHEMMVKVGGQQEKLLKSQEGRKETFYPFVGGDAGGGPEGRGAGPEHGHPQQGGQVQGHSG